jgi:hypothetical protein
VRAPINSGGTFEQFVVQVLGQIGQHPKILQKTLKASEKEKGKSIRPLKAKLTKLQKSIKETIASLKNYLDLANKGSEQLVSELMVEAEQLAKQKHAQELELELEIEKVKMEINFRERVVVDEKIIAESLLQFHEVFGSLDFDSQKQLLKLLVKEIEVSRLDPEKDDLPGDPSAYDLQIRTSLYRLKFKFYTDSLFQRTYAKLPKCSHLSANGGQGGIALASLTRSPVGALLPAQTRSPSARRPSRPNTSPQPVLRLGGMTVPFVARTSTAAGLLAGIPRDRASKGILRSHSSSEEWRTGWDSNPR